MSPIAILGSGFGLYGYLPALVAHCVQRVVLPERYRQRLEERSELAQYASQRGVGYRRMVGPASGVGGRVGTLPRDAEPLAGRLFISTDQRNLGVCLRTLVVDRQARSRVPVASVPDDTSVDLR